jgi:hypothetical protein
MTLQQIAVIYGISRERVRQILRKDGVDRKEGGAWIRHPWLKERERRQAQIANKSLRIWQRWGLSLDEYEPLRKQFGSTTNPRSPFRRYVEQRKNARQRGIGWGLSFKQWWTLWNESLHWKQRGLGANKYVLARYGDSGPYEVGNVYICTLAENGRDQWLVRDRKKLRG